MAGLAAHGRLRVREPSLKFLNVVRGFGEELNATLDNLKRSDDDVEVVVVVERGHMIEKQLCSLLRERLRHIVRYVFYRLGSCLPLGVLQILEILLVERQSLLQRAGAAHLEDEVARQLVALLHAIDELVDLELHLVGESLVMAAELGHLNVRQQGLYESS